MTVKDGVLTKDDSAEQQYYKGLPIVMEDKMEHELTQDADMTCD